MNEETLFVTIYCSLTDLEGDEDDEVGEVEGEDLAAGGGSGHNLQGGGQEGSLLSCSHS